MAIDRTADRAKVFNEAGVPVTSGSMSGRGVVRVADQPLLESIGAADLIGRAKVVTVITSDFPTIATGAAITVDGTALNVRSRLAGSDGGITRLLVAAGT